MHWLIHNKFDHDKKIQELVFNLKRLDIEYTRASVVPFSDDGITFEDSNITIESLQNEKIFTYGSYTMANISHKHFKPGAFISPLISMEHLTSNYGKEMLNYDMIVDTIENIDTDMDNFFIRPLEDTKSIVGQVISKSEFINWKNKIISSHKEHPDTYCTLYPSTKICIAPIKNIDAEYRCFIINKKVATASQYKMNGIAHITPHVDEYIIDYVNRLVKMWSPDIAFVLDVALVNRVPYIIEANCINSSGLYEIDTQKLIIEIEKI